MSTHRCKCQSCGVQYSMDVMVPDDIWGQIKPEGKPEGSGLLCGACICLRMDMMGYSAWELSDIDRADERTEK